MPDLNWNKAYWGGEYNWQTRGEEWSETWGGSEPQWFGCLYPRLHRFMPANAILEIAPGYGRWTKYLLPACREFLGIDLSGECVSACNETFKTVRHASFAQNDGLALDAAPDGHFDLVFSFDSLVHAEINVMESYIQQILRKLTPSGVAFLHHSNMEALGPGAENHHMRSPSVSGRIVAERVAASGGKLLAQERICWGGPIFNDCLTLFARREHPHDAPAFQSDNAHFMEEALNIRTFQAPYSSIAPGAAHGQAGKRISGFWRRWSR